MKNRTLILLLFFCLLLSSCEGKPIENIVITPGESAEIAGPKLTAEFSVLDEGIEKLKSLEYGTEGWGLYSGGEYLFATLGFKNFLVRYDISENKVDNVVEFEKPDGFWFSTAVSADGEEVLSKAGNYPEFKEWTNQILIDFGIKDCKRVPDKFKFPYRENNAYSLYSVETVWDDDGEYFYKLTAINESVNDEEIRSVPGFAISTSSYVIIDENRMGVITGIGIGCKFMIIDIAQDKIIQECAINE